MMYYVTCTLCLTAAVTIATASLIKLQYDMDKVLDRLLTSVRFQKITDRIADRAAAERVVKLQDNLASESDENYEEEENEEINRLAIEDKELRDTKVLARKALPKPDTKNVRAREEITPKTLDRKIGVKDDLTKKSEETHDDKIDLNNLLNKIIMNSQINLTGLNSKEPSLNYKHIKVNDNKPPCSSVFDLKDEIQVDPSSKKQIDLLSLLKSKTDLVHKATDTRNDYDNNGNTFEMGSEYEITESDYTYDSGEKNTEEYVDMALINAGVAIGDSKGRVDDAPEYSDSSRTVELKNLVSEENEEHKKSD